MFNVCLRVEVAIIFYIFVFIIQGQFPHYLITSEPSQARVQWCLVCWAHEHARHYIFTNMPSGLLPELVRKPSIEPLVARVLHQAAVRKYNCKKYHKLLLTSSSPSSNKTLLNTMQSELEQQDEVESSTKIFKQTELEQQLVSNPARLF